MPREEKNLIPFNQRTEDEQREIASKGGKASGKSRRRKKTMKQVMDMLLSKPANAIDDWQLLADLGLTLDELEAEDVTNLLIVNAALLMNAKNGDVNAIKELRNIIQDDAYQKHKIKLDNAYLRLERAKNAPSEDA